MPCLEWDQNPDQGHSGACVLTIQLSSSLVQFPYPYSVCGISLVTVSTPLFIHSPRIVSLILTVTNVQVAQFSTCTQGRSINHSAQLVHNADHGTNVVCQLAVVIFTHDGKRHTQSGNRTQLVLEWTSVLTVMLSNISYVTNLPRPTCLCSILLRGE